MKCLIIQPHFIMLAQIGAQIWIRNSNVNCELSKTSGFDSVFIEIVEVILE